MPLPKDPSYTIKDIYNLPDGQRAELIDGVMYDMDAAKLYASKISFAINQSHWKLYQ